MSLSTLARVAAVLLAGAVALVLLLNEPSASPEATPSTYPSCGMSWNRNTPVSSAERRVNRCIVQAFRHGRRARAVAVLTTIEGDPIASYVFVRGKRDVLVVVDSTRDAFGARIWQRLRCSELVLLDGRIGWTGCRSLGTGKPSWLRPVRLPR